MQAIKNIVYLQPQLSDGLVVQLVRIHACHAWGRGFESRPDREIGKRFSEMKTFFAQKTNGNAFTKSFRDM